ncbi:general substrate transporter [Myriangium duriaei CBS 260.36]|uniref:General substrate transporter n=1 Tax=Myriangium duriaei CBS 260.36 TaxID=1168546 RepID=A0A9P4MJR9_9PEZI|nr:general substrate transporter [Myriangium duriaei CBS 260.36]
MSDSQHVSARAPLIAHESADQRQEQEQGTPSSPSAHHAAADGPLPSSPNPSQFSTYLLITTASISGLLFGFDTGIISSTLLYLPSSFPVSTFAKSLITSATALFALIASPLSAPAADSLGRRPVIVVSCALFVLGALIQAVAPGVAVMVLGRSVVGLAIGGASSVVPLYIAEVAPARHRGRLVTVQSLFITGGQVVAYLVGWACGGRWRLAVGVGAVPAVVQAVMMGWLVETPRFLVMKGSEERARVVLRGLGVENVDVDVVVERIRAEIKEEGGSGDDGWRSRWNDLVKTGGNRRALTIACMLQGLQQLCGFNVLMYFSATIFALVGFTSPVTTSLSIALTNFLFTLFAFSLIDAIGRRRILLISMPFMVIGLALCALCFAYLPQMGAGQADGAVALRMRASPDISLSTLPAALLISLILYVAAYALGLGCVPWQQSELFPLRVRSLGSGLATATNWSSNFVVGITFLPMMDALGSTWTFALYGCVCFVGWFLVYGFYPETAGLELEDVGKLLSSGWGVNESVSSRNKGYTQAPDQDEDEADSP